MKRKMKKILAKATHGLINYSEYCAINSYEGWVKWCDSFRLYMKYIKPLKVHATTYWILNIKKGVLA